MGHECGQPRSLTGALGTYNVYICKKDSRLAMFLGIAHATQERAHHYDDYVIVFLSALNFLRKKLQDTLKIHVFSFALWLFYHIKGLSLSGIR